MPTGNSLDDAILENKNEDDLDIVSNKDKLNVDGKYDADELDSQVSTGVESYDNQIKNVLLTLEENADKYLNMTALQTYSPKFYNILKTFLMKNTEVFILFIVSLEL